MFGHPLLQHFVTVSVSEPEVTGRFSDTLAILALVGLAIFGIVKTLVRARRPSPRRSRGSTRPKRPPRAPGRRHRAEPERPAVLIDGSNVIHWQDNTPQLAPLLQVVQEMSRRGLKPGVVFDANIGYKLTGKFMDERDLSRILSLPRDRILVVPKGMQADSYLLETARDLQARIVTNDRYRDWSDRFPDIAKPETLIRGGMREGKLWLQETEVRDGMR